MSNIYNILIPATAVIIIQTLSTMIYIIFFIYISHSEKIVPEKRDIISECEVLCMKKINKINNNMSYEVSNMETNNSNSKDNVERECDTCPASVMYSSDGYWQNDCDYHGNLTDCQNDRRRYKMTHLELAVDCMNEISAPSFTIFDWKGCFKRVSKPTLLELNGFAKRLTLLEESKSTPAIECVNEPPEYDPVDGFTCKGCDSYTNGYCNLSW